MSIYLIAEAGVNHNGDMELAKQLIIQAKAAGCDCIKFQTFQTEKIVTVHAQKADYQSQNTGTSGSQYEMLKRLELSFAQFKEIKRCCDTQEIDFMSTPFDEEAVDWLEELGVAQYKLSSGDLTNKRLLQYVARTGKPLILSTGMSTEEEIEEALTWIADIGKNPVTLLHCTSNYPARYEDVNMNAMVSMKKRFHLPVGYSDHTPGTEVPVMAAALGAEVIEKHVTLSKRLQGPDHAASLNIQELSQMVKSIRNVEKAFGDDAKRMTESEQNTRLVARKSITVTKALSKGHTIVEGDLDIKRPGDGIPPKYLDALQGKKLARDIDADTTLHFEDIE